MSGASRREFLKITGKYAFLGLGLAPSVSALVTGCKTLEVATDVGTSVGVATGTLSQSQAESLRKSAKAVSKTFQDFTPEQEYYIGRTISAVILSKYSPYEDEEANMYINLLGQSLARASEMPETFKGYHFLIQDSNEINALAAPGGFIFVTRGIIRCCEHEDALAAILAHEIGHVQAKHGLQAIKNSRITTALTTLGIEGVKTFAGPELANLTKTFEDSITDITSTLINNGYSRAFEQQADTAAVTIMREIGYDPNGLVEMLRIMEENLRPGTPDFAKTHPSPTSRISDIQNMIGPYRGVERPEKRQARFRKALGGV